MAKNMTRKGLGLGAALSVVAASLVVAAPAQAATVTLAPDAGTEYRVPITEEFKLTSRFDVTANSFNDVLDVIIYDADKNLNAVTVENGSIAYDDDLDAWVGATTAAPSAGAYTDITLDPSTDDETFSVTVQTGFDLSATGVFGGASSPEREVFFHVADDYTWNVDFDQPVLGDTDLTATVTTSPALNLAQIASAVTVGFGYMQESGTVVREDASTVSSDINRFDAGEAVTYDAVRVEYTSEATVSGAGVVAERTYVAAVLLNGEQVSDFSYGIVAAATIDQLTTPKLVASVDTNPTTGKVRAEATTFQVSVDATLNDGTDDVAVDAGETVTFTISGNGDFDADAVITVGAETYDADSTEALEVDVLTDADGTATLTLSIDGFVNEDSVNIAASAQSASGGTQTNFEFLETAAASLLDYNLVGKNADMKVAAGSSYTLSYVAIDNFGQPLEGDFYVRLTNGDATEDQQKKISNGVATFSLTDSSDLVESYKAHLYEVDGFNFSRVSTYEVTTTPAVGVIPAAAKVTATEPASAGALLLADMEDADTRIGELAPDNTDTVTPVTIGGKVTSSTGVVTWSTVTLSAPGVLFAAEAETKMVYSVGSITVTTSTAGLYEVKAFSNTSGEHTVTVTAGAATETVDIEFEAAGPLTGANLVIDAPVAVAPGSTVIATATLTDEYGNPVKTDATASFEVAYDGPGLEVVSDDNTDADGEARIAYFLGANDSGTITVTFSYSGSANSDFTGDDDLVVQKTIYIGAAPSAEVATWTKNLGDGTVKMYAKNIVGAGKVQFMLNGEEIAWVRAADATDPKLRMSDAGAYYLVRTVELVEGQKNVLEIYVDGERTTRTAYTY